MIIMSRFVCNFQNKFALSQGRANRIRLVPLSDVLTYRLNTPVEKYSALIKRLAMSLPLDYRLLEKCTLEQNPLKSIMWVRRLAITWQIIYNMFYGFSCVAKHNIWNRNHTYSFWNTLSFDFKSLSID